MVSSLEPMRFKAMMAGAEEFLLLDVRQPEEHAFASIENDLLIPLGELAGRESEVAGWRTRLVVVYCHHGIRSAQAATFLAGSGYAKVFNLSGGIDRWSAEIDPTVPRY